MGDDQARRFSYTCRACRARADYWTPSCPMCRRNGAMVPSGSMKAVAAPAPRRSTLADAKRLIVRRVSTGIAGLDRVLGRNWDTGATGLAVPSLIIFAGAAGCGKSTLLMRMCASVRARGVLYLSTEQTLEEIRDNAERCGLTEADMVRIDARHAKNLEECFEIIHELDPEVVVVDSFQETKSASDTRDVAQNDISHALQFKKEVDDHKRTIILLWHLNKEDALAGAQRLQHIVSVVMRLERVTDPEHADHRFVHCPSKNRFGSTSEKAFFRLTERGMVDAIEPAPAERDDDGPRPRRQRGAAGARHVARDRDGD